MEVKKIVACLLTVVLLSGCATRQISFISTPTGASVQVGDQTGITPCMLTVPDEVEEATFELSSGEKLTLPLPDPDIKSGGFVNGARKVVGGTVTASGGVAVIAGLVVMFGSSDDDRLNQQEDDWDDDSLLAGAAMTGSGVLVFLFGLWIYDTEEDVPVLHAKFLQDENQAGTDGGNIDRIIIRKFLQDRNGSGTTDP